MLTLAQSARNRVVARFLFHLLYDTYITMCKHNAKRTAYQAVFSRTRARSAGQPLMKLATNMHQAIVYESNTIAGHLSHSSHDAV